ncbi:MAG TPA: permease-like cell division protein FtsX [Candidatus Andersenbacteria bacterium]|nr:permease-like cell division protein FtsX [Candidatus Andersenbacteria bacterium]
MIGISFIRVMNNAFRNFRRNVWLSIATTLIMTLTLCIILFLYIVNVLGAEFLRNVEQKVDIAVTFKDSTSREQVAIIQKDIAARSDVENTRIVTSEEALKEYRKRHADEPFIEEALQELNKNPLPSNMYIVAKDPRFYENITASLRSDKYSAFIEKVNFQDSKVIIEKMIRIMDLIKKAGLIATGIFGLLVILIMFNTIRLAIYSFREEIDIMRLVGASRWYIQGPFLMESVLVALISVCIATTIFYIALNTGATNINQFFFTGQNTTFDIYRYVVSHWIQIVGLQLGAAIGLAVLSSYIAVRRYLR